jgi:hypothetical protein
LFSSSDLQIKRSINYKLFFPFRRTSCSFLRPAAEGEAMHAMTERYSGDQLPVKEPSRRAELALTHGEDGGAAAAADFSFEEIRCC